MLKNISDALNKWLDVTVAQDGSLHFNLTKGFEKVPASYPSVDAYFASLLDAESWLAKENGKYRVTDLLGFIRGTNLSRGKDCPGFDTFHYTAENNAFGKPEETGVHFSASVAKVLATHQTKYKSMTGYAECDVDAYIADGQREDLACQTYLMNATHILLNVAAGKVEATPSRHWRTRNGTADERTAVSYTHLTLPTMAVV